MPGRNDPCPCGSGKKYKHCCLKKDEAARRTAYEEAALAAEAAPPAIPQPTPPRIPSMAEVYDALRAESEPIAAANDAYSDEPDASDDLAPFEARWREFEAAGNYEEQITIFLATLDDGLMDDENAFEMLNAIYATTAAAGARERFDPLLALLRQRVPDVYAEDAHVYLDWLITNALVAGRPDVLPALADELADTADKQLDTVSCVFDQLAYHGQLSVLAAAARRAWPRVRDGKGYFEWAIREFGVRAMTLAMLDYLEHTTAPNAADLEALIADFGVAEVRPGGAAQFLALITGQAGRRWTLDDFQRPAHRRRKGKSAPPANDGQTNVYDLTLEFLGTLRREDGVSYAKGELARDQIERYILDRQAGELDDENDRRAANALAATPVHPLCPDFATLDRYLGGLLHLFNMQLHKAAALFEMIPAWLRFLETRGLIDAAQRERTLSDLSSLVPTLSEFWGTFRSDPGLQRAAERWPEGEGTTSAA